jgi:hypothetical protein
MTTSTLVLAAAAGLLLSFAPAASADPAKCVVVRDTAGNPIDTVCVPVPGR